ncbi:Beta-fructofuranosidase, soluble isoenzyme I [Salvia divinorum]|uniref:beta-fructofuranosidase n=1 Tax=Salvia divinorum TaxID=28513 RepID=A0ABD1HSD6_SALDI
MATSSFRSPPYDVESAAASYAPIPAAPEAERPKTKKLFATILLSSLFLFLLIIINQKPIPKAELDVSNATISRGVAQGVSEKVFRGVSGGNLSFAWSNVMLSWQRTAYHFQPQKNWINGPLFYNGWYHLFYQYNPDSAVWGNITWAHAVSRDLIHWLHLPFAMVPDQWYDINGVWTGSATILPDGRIVMLYTGDTRDKVQVQCLAYPANLSDPLLLDWVKDSNNPVLFPPPGIGSKDFRDPTTAWRSPDGDKWRITIGSKVNKTGISLIYETKDFIEYELSEEYLHQVPGTGMWECVDFYPVSLTAENGLDTSANGPGIKHVLKTSLDDDKNDYYALGVYDPIKNKWIPDDPEFDVGIGLRYDYGTYYASKTFYDQNTQRRILWGWIRETDAESVDLLKGWSGIQSIPRSIVMDKKNWQKHTSMARALIQLTLDSPSQLDLVATFDIDEATASASASGDNMSYECSTSGGAANRGVLGPFGVLVLADEILSELTPIYFYVVKGSNGNTHTHFCADELRSSKANDVEKIVYGSEVPVVDGEKLSLRSLVDHSIVESFAQGGRRVITSRVYPTKAINGVARVFLFNNATEATVTASLKIWKMDSADIHPFPFDHI